MNLEIGKLIRFFINYAKLSNYIYIPTQTRMIAISLVDLMKDPNIGILLKSIGIKRYLDGVSISGTATSDDLASFLRVPEAKLILTKIVNNSTAKNEFESLDDLFDDITSRLNRG